MDTTPPPNRSFLASLFLSPSEPRLRAGWRLLGQLFLLGGISILFSVMLGAGLLLADHLRPGSASVLAEFSLPLVSLLAVTLSVYLARRLLDHRSFVSLGLRWDGLAIRDLFVGIGIAAAMIGVIFAFEWAFGWLRFAGFAWQHQNDALFPTLLMLFTFILVGWQEELLFRGYTLQNLADGLTLIWGIILSSSVFGLVHLANPNATWISAIGVTLAGLFMAFAYLRTRQLWLPIGLHIGWNFFEGVAFGFPVSGLDTFHLIEHTVSGPELWTGGAFGPEAGLILLPALALGTAAIFSYTKYAM